MTLPSPLAAAAVLALLALSGCENDGATLFDEFLAPVSPKGVSLSVNVQPIFTNNCALAGCHAGPFPQEGQSLEAGKLFDPVVGIVGVASRQAAGLNRVEPGNSDASYLIDKLEGSQIAAGGFGQRMPFGANPLGPEAIQVIRDWIDEGALDN